MSEIYKGSQALLDGPFMSVAKADAQVELVWDQSQNAAQVARNLGLSTILIHYVQNQNQAHSDGKKVTQQSVMGLYYLGIRGDRVVQGVAFVDDEHSAGLDDAGRQKYGKQAVALTPDASSAVCVPHILNEAVLLAEFSTVVSDEAAAAEHLHAA